MASSAGRRVLVTGVGGPLAAAVAGGLAEREGTERVVGLDTEPPPGAPAIEFVKGDLRSPLVAEVLEASGIDTVVHLDIETMSRKAGGRARMKEHNVMGTMHLLAAAQNAPALRQVVVRSTTAVYGSSHRNPALLREDALTSPPRAGYAKDAAEMEGYARGLARRRDDVTVTVLRLATPVGPTVDSPLSLYFELPVAPTLLGYDPRIQLLHEDDAAELIALAVGAGHPGVFNVAAPGAMYLSQALRLAGKPPVPVAKPLMPWVAGLMRSAGLVDFSADQLEYLLHGRVADISRHREVFGVVPRRTTREAFEDFLAARSLEPVLDAELLDRVERAAYRLLTGQGAAR